MEPEEKIKHGLHPNSLKNLKPIQPGEVRNPRGAGAHDKEKKRLKDFTHEIAKEVVRVGLTGTLNDLKDIATDPEESAIKRGIAKAIGDAVVAGDYLMLERIFERLTGKVAVVVEQNITSAPQVIITLPAKDPKE